MTKKYFLGVCVLLLLAACSKPNSFNDLDPKGKALFFELRHKYDSTCPYTSKDKAEAESCKQEVVKTCRAELGDSICMYEIPMDKKYFK